MHSGVIPEVGFVGEGLSAGFAGVRPLARVDSDVDFQVESAAELLSAGLAGIWLFNQMRPQVTSQRGRVLKYFFTSAAGVRLLEEGELVLRARLHRKLISTDDDTVSMATGSLERGTMLRENLAVFTKLLTLREGGAVSQELLTVPLCFIVGDHHQRDISLLLQWSLTPCLTPVHVPLFLLYARDLLHLVVGEEDLLLWGDLFHKACEGRAE